MQIGHLREFLTLAANANFSATAKELYITQSALSRHIASLEEELGAKLLARDSHQVSLTPIGRQFAADAEGIVESYERALGNIEILRRRGEATLKIGYLYDVGAIIMPLFRPALSAMAEREGIHLRFSALEHGTLMTRLARDVVDVAITIDTDARVRDFSERLDLGEDCYCAVVPPSHRLAGRETVSLAELAEEDFIMPDPFAMAATHDFIAAQFDHRGLAPSVITFYEDIPTFMDEVSYGTGVGLALDHHRSRYERSVAFIPLESCELRCRICCLWKSKTERKVPGSWAAVLREQAERYRSLAAGQGAGRRA